MLNLAIIGMGGMGTRYAGVVLRDKKMFKVTAITRIKPESMEKIKDVFDENTKIYQSDDLLFEAYDKGEFLCDAVIIATPHLAHEHEVKEAFKRGFHVLCDKPAGVELRAGREMLLAKPSDCKYGFVFHQRLYPVNQCLKEMVDSEIYGKVKRVSYTVTDWYRTEAYYHSAAWRSNYKTDGGGTLLNQCPHSLDLLCYLFGMPCSLIAFCKEGKYHQIEVEDEVTSYLEWANGITGVFTASTGECPGVNRLEIAFERAVVTCSKFDIEVKENELKEEEYRKMSMEDYSRMAVPVISKENHPNTGDVYFPVIKNFYEAVTEEKKILAGGEDSLMSLYLSNAMYLSSYKKEIIHLYPVGSKKEIEFEKEFDAWYQMKIKEE